MANIGQGGADVAFGARPGRSSSNAFATGADQNRGNSITDTPTTRVAAPPGGSSNISLGWDDQQPVRPGSRTSNPPQPFGAGGGVGPAQGSDMVHGGRGRTSSNSYANGSNQNCGNVMTDHPSTRVAAPPGGSSSFSLDHGQEAQRPGSRNQGPASYGGQGGYGGSGGCGGQGGYGGGGGGTFGERPNVHSANTFANGSNQNCGNVLTDRPTTRVRAAPGGNSSLTLG